MSNDKSRNALLEFLVWIEDKGLMPSRTAGNRRGAASKVLAILDDQEAQDVLSLDVEHLMQRFENLHRGKYSPSSLATYRANMIGALNDFRAYLKDPVGFKPMTKRRSVSKKPNKTDGNADTQERVEKHGIASLERHVNALDSGPTTNVLPIQIRSDLVVKLHGLPFDLTKAEANKIANIVLAHVLAET